MVPNAGRPKFLCFSSHFLWWLASWQRAMWHRRHCGTDLLPNSLHHTCAAQPLAIFPKIVFVYLCLYFCMYLYYHMYLLYFSIRISTLLPNSSYHTCASISSHLSTNCNFPSFETISTSAQISPTIKDHLSGRRADWLATKINKIMSPTQING